MILASDSASIVNMSSSVQVHFKVKTHTKFQKIMEAYAGKRSVDATAIRFLYDGQRLAPESTPGEISSVLETHIFYHIPCL